MQQIFHPVRARQSSFATPGRKAIGEAASWPIAHRGYAGLQQHDTIVNSRAVERERRHRQPFGEFVVDRIASGRAVCMPSLKTAICCHLLPFRNLKIVRFVAICPFSLPLEGVPASPGLGLRTVSGAVKRPPETVGSPQSAHAAERARHPLQP